MNIIKWIAGFALTFYLATLVLLYVGQRSLIYLPETRWLEPGEAGASGFQTIVIGKAAAAQKSWWRAPPTPDAPVILHFHGNGGSVANRAGQYFALAGADYGLLAAEYPDYAGNPGVLSEASLIGSAQRHYDWLIAQGYKPRQIIIAGQSLGTGVAVHLASKNAAAGLLLEAPFSSIADVAAATVPWVPVRLLLKDHFDSMARIGSVRMPVAWAHGDEDEVIAFSFGQKLFEAAKNPKCARRVKGAGHNNLWQNDIAEFFRTNVAAMSKGQGCVAGN